MSRMRTLRRNLDEDAVKRARVYQRKEDTRLLLAENRHAVKRAAERLGVPPYMVYRRLRTEGVIEDLLIKD